MLRKNNIPNGKALTAENAESAEEDRVRNGQNGKALTAENAESAEEDRVRNGQTAGQRREPGTGNRATKRKRPKRQDKKFKVQSSK